jgi:hypothetical protein
MKSKSLEGLRQAKMMQTQELVSSFQVRKKIILRRAGQECFVCFAKSKRKRWPARGARCWARHRRLIDCLLNPLILTEDGRDDYLCAEHYYMFGNFDKDPDRFPQLRQFALNFLRELGYGEGRGRGASGAGAQCSGKRRYLVGTGQRRRPDAGGSQRKRPSRHLDAACYSAPAFFPTSLLLMKRFRCSPNMRRG